MIDTELPSVVESRAERLLGHRLVDVMISSDEKSYVMGVYNLQPSEAPTLRAELAQKAPLTVANRTVSRRQLDAAAASVEQVVTAPGSGASALWTDHEAGAVVVQTTEQL